MKSNDQYSLTAFRQVQSFLNENAAKVGILADCEGRHLLDDAVAQIEAYGLGQSSAILEIQGSINLQKSLEADLRSEHMNPIVEYAKAKLNGVPDFAALTRSPSHLKAHALVRAARAMAAAAQPYADALTRNKFPADALEQLNKAADAVEASISNRGNLKVQRIGATEGITEHVKRGNEAVKMIGAVIVRQFRKDQAFMAAWRSAKRPATKPGFARGTGPTTAPATPAPATPTAPTAPAAPGAKEGPATA